MSWLKQSNTLWYTSAASTPYEIVEGRLPLFPASGGALARRSCLECK